MNVLSDWDLRFAQLTSWVGRFLNMNISQGRPDLDTEHGTPCLSKERKGKERKIIYTAPLCIPQSAQAWITQFYLQITPCMLFLRKRSPDGATPNWGCRHPIAAHYLSVDREGMKGWVGLVGWLIADGLLT